MSLAPDRKPPPPAPPRKQRQGMKRVSAKRAKLMREVGPQRLAMKAQVGECMICRQPFLPEELDIDEIARGYSRGVCLEEPFLWLVSCRPCHQKSQDWPIVKRIAARIRWQIDTSCRLYNELRGTAPTHVTADDVIGRLMFKNLKPLPKR